MARKAEISLIILLLVAVIWIGVRPNRSEADNPNRIVACEPHSSSWIPHYMNCAGP
jgi:hypothetical protein